MKNILVIPIDNRPVCYELPCLIASLDKTNNIIIPDKKLLGDLTKQADIDMILDFADKTENIDIIVACLDTVAYGGLIPSRRSNDGIEKIKSRTEKFTEIIKKKGAKAFVFSSIMRISNNNVNEEEKEYWSEWGKKIFQYSYEMHKYGTSEVKDIPDDVLSDYLDTRKRNFEINKYYIELQKNNIFDTLIFSKDDCAEYGFNVAEAEELKKLSKNNKNILIKTGADEIPLTLLSRALNGDRKIKIAPVYTNPDSIDKISKYEDISVEESVKSQIETSGGILANEKDCDLVLYVNNFKNRQGELVMNIKEPLFNDELKLPKKPYFMADILNANGSDNNFISKLFKTNFTQNFYGYAGWNTTGNTLGSAISAALTYFCAEKPDKNIFDKLQTIRFLDDYAYQANIRSEIRNNPENLTNGIINEKMKPFREKINKFFNADNNLFYSFPWNRFFEIGIYSG